MENAGKGWLFPSQVKTLKKLQFLSASFTYTLTAVFANRPFADPADCQESGKLIDDRLAIRKS